MIRTLYSSISKGLLQDGKQDYSPSMSQPLESVDLGRLARVILREEGGRRVHFREMPWEKLHWPQLALKMKEEGHESRNVGTSRSQ